MKWRVGRSLGRTLYIQTEEEPSKFDVFVGIMDTRDLAEQVVAAMNASEDLYAKVEALRAVPSTYDGVPIKVDPATIQGVLAVIAGSSND